MLQLFPLLLFFLDKKRNKSVKTYFLFIEKKKAKPNN